MSLTFKFNLVIVIMIDNKRMKLPAASSGVSF